MAQQEAKNQVKAGVIVALISLVLAAPSGISQTPVGTTSAESPSAEGVFPGGDGLSGLGQALGRVGAANDMIGFSHSDSSGTQTITLVHTGKSWIAVYHIDRSGKIHLVSSRPIDADFSLQLNATSPLPDEIREIGRR